MSYFIDEIGIIGLLICWIVVLIFLFSGAWHVSLVIGIPLALLTFVRIKQ